MPLKQLIRIKPNEFNPTGQLFEHQRKGVEHAYNQPRYIAAWDMGTGKTIFGIERDLHLRNEGHVFKTLVIAPLATHQSWKETIEYGTDYKAYVVNTKQGFRKYFLQHAQNPKSEYAYFIINIEGLKTKALREPTLCKRCKNFEQPANKSMAPKVVRVCKCKNKLIRYKYHLENVGFDHLILDECHSIKNRKSQQSVAVKQLKIKCITDMSGSPATTRPDDLWSILNHVKPKTFGRGGYSYWKFFSEYIDYTEGFDGYKKINGPNQKWIDEGLPSIRPFYSRVLKTDVFDLPPVMEQNRFVTLHKEQRKLYDEMDNKMVAWLEDQKGLPVVMVSKAAMVKTQRLQIFALGTPKFTGHKELSDGKKQLLYTLEEPSAKIDETISLLKEFAPKKFVVFSQFSKPIELLCKRLNKEGIKYSKYTGDVPQKLKPLARKRFIEDPEVQVFAATIGSAGTGLDGLQHVCDDLIFLDRSWSPAKNDQAISRLHRAGQKNTVNVINIIAKDTIDYERLLGIKSKYHELLRTLGDIK